MRRSTLRTTTTERSNITDKPAAKQRVYRSEIAVSLLGIMNVTGDILPVRFSSKEQEFISLCPACEQPHKLSTKYHCSEGHGPYERSDVLKGKALPDKRLVRVTAEEVTDVRSATLPKGQLSLTPYHAKGVNAYTRAGGTAYRLRPKASSEVYDLLRDLAVDPELALIGELALDETTLPDGTKRGANQKLFRVELWNDQLVLQELVRPDDLAPADAVVGVENRNLKAVELARELLSTQVADFDPEVHRNTVKERALELMAAKADDPDAVAPIAIAKAQPAAGGVDLVALLEASVAASKPKKAAAPKKRVAKARTSKAA